MGIGMQNKDGEYEKTNGLENGHWYLDPDGLLFIVPTEEDGLAEIEGPDGAILDQLNAVYRETPFEKVDQRQVAADLGLDIVLDVLKRFDPETGFYHA
jgi:hypothetical protein